MIDFNQRIVVITGAAQGLGASMVKKFLEEGATGVALLDFNEKKLNETVKRIDPSGTRTRAVLCDVSDETSVVNAFKVVLAHFGRVDILINNAGITRDALTVKMTASQFNKVIQVSLNGSFHCIQQVLPSMIENGWGRIISLSSLAARGNMGQINYASAKAGIIGLTKTLSLEVAEKNITVNCIAPGIVNTEIIQTIPEKTKNYFLKSIPMHRFGEPEEIASLAAFLASDDAAYISGQCIKISGGLQ